MPVLTAIDLLGIQRFVFSSNRLRDVIGASLLIARACSFEIDGPLANLVPETHRLMAAGGAALVCFDSIDAARDFAGTYSRWLYHEAPGLEVVIVHRRFRDGELAAAARAIQVDLARAKTERAPSVPLPGLSVTETSVETGAPAVAMRNLPRSAPAPSSRVTIKAREAWKGERTSSHWSCRLGELSKATGRVLARPREIDHLGRSHGDTSLVAVVHIDGNGVGRKISDWLRASVESERPDEDMRRGYQKMSKSLDGLATLAMDRVLERVALSLETKENNEGKRVTLVRSGVPDLAFDLIPAVASEEDGDEAGVCMPVWPVLVGGDDLTFVCDGRLALDLTATALAVFEDARICELGAITASAGVAIVRSHAPFDRAYKLAEKLCTEAKLAGERQGLWLDWYLGEARPGESVRALRDRQYDGGRLTARPVEMGHRGAQGTWRWMDAELLSPGGERSLRGVLWRERRNKVKELRERLREGADAVTRALEGWQRVDERLRLPVGAHANQGTALLDAIELVDIHVPLDPTDAQVRS